GRGVEADEAALARDPARRVETLHADVVEVAGPVDGRAGVGLREHDEPRLARERPQRRRQLGEALRDAAMPGLAQHAEPAARDDAQLVFARDRRELVVAAA